MSSSQRPVYIPRKRKLATASNADQTSSKSKGESYQTKRQFQKQQQPRFHGAFTGGFSAGYFNTVGTKEGWKPSLVKKRDQKLEDFMDDEDHANWGGPTRLRDEYGTKTPAGDREDGAEDKAATSRTPFLPKSMLEVSHQTVGPRLLRRLGWREGGTAIVPENATTLRDNNSGDTLEQLARIHLSRRRLRKIQLQSSRVKLPPPKLDKCGLGFEPYKDAPEFKKYRERRKQQAKDRASYNSRVNVYRVSDVADEGGASKKKPHDNNDGDYLTYETAEDFVGKRSAAGFALRDDEDDAYDDDVGIYKNGKKTGGDPSTGPKRLSVGEEYNTEVYEHESSDDDNYGNSVPALNHTNRKNQNKSVDVGNLFASWAGTDQPSTVSSKASVPRAALTSDGKPPLEGFVLGDSMDSNQKRYAGPEMPRDYAIQRHKFGEHENPYVLEAISNAVKLEQREEQWKQQQTQRPPIQEARPLSNNFSTLAQAMKNRFTSSTEDSSKTGEATTEAPKSLPAGLHMPKPVENKEVRTEPKVVEQPKKDIKITRSVKSFFPNPLVCKRFRVPMPSNAKRNTGLVATDEAKSSESVYFEREILGKATKLQKMEKGPTQKQENATKPVPGNRDEPVPEGIVRPSIANLRKIFEASSDESSSSDDGDESVEEEKLEQSRSPEKPHSAQVDESNPKDQGLEVATKGRGDASKDDDLSLRSSDSEASSSRERRRRRKERHRRKHSRKKHKRKRKEHYYSDDESSMSDNDDRRRRHKKRRKKSSRHKSRKREKGEK